MNDPRIVQQVAIRRAEQWAIEAAVAAQAGNWKLMQEKEQAVRRAKQWAQTAVLESAQSEISK